MKTTQQVSTAQYQRCAESSSPPTMARSEPDGDLHRGPGGGPVAARCSSCVPSSSAPPIAASSASSSSRERAVSGSRRTRPAARRAPSAAQHRARRLADAPEDVLHGRRRLRQVLLLPVAEQPVAHLRPAPVPVPTRRRAAAPAAAAPADRGAGCAVASSRAGSRRGRGQRRARQVQGQGVGPLGAAGGEQQQPQPLGGDLGVGDPALHQRAPSPRRASPPPAGPGSSWPSRAAGRCPRARLPRAFSDLVRAGVEQVQLGVQQLGQPRPERLPQPLQDALGRRLRHEQRTGPPRCRRRPCARPPYSRAGRRGRPRRTGT